MDFLERDIIIILNSLNITMHYLKWHTPQDKNFLKIFFNFDNYAEDYNYIQSLHRIISLRYNKELYNLQDEVVFKGQSDYLISAEKDYAFLKNAARYENVKKENKFKNNIAPIKSYFKNKFNFFRNGIDKEKKVV